MRTHLLVFPSSRLLVFISLALIAPAAHAQNWVNAKDRKTNQSSFRAIEEWPDPNEYRNAAGSPGPKYWQQQVDYAIKATLDTVRHAVTGSERVTYRNNSPDVLSYVWFQLDQNIDRPDSRAALVEQALPTRIPEQARRFLAPEAFDGGYKLTRVQVVDAKGVKRDARYIINGTVMKVHLAAPISTGQAAVIEIDWNNLIPEGGRNGRGAKELVKDGWLYELAQWFPRASVYDDVNGWATDQFLGQGEFYLNFGNYDVELTVPRNHIVNATGVLANAAQVLTATQQQRLAKAWTSETPVFIVAPDEVMRPETRPAGTGLLLYLKLSVTGNESELIRRYRHNHPEFPHQPTLDQFFDQEQFEAYRQLGVHVAEGLFLPALLNGRQPASVPEWFRQLAGNLLEPVRS